MNKIAAEKTIANNAESRADSSLVAVSVSQKQTSKASWQGSKKPQAKTGTLIKEKNGAKKKHHSLLENRSGMQTKAEFPLWISVSEAAALGGVQHKTIRRAIKDDPRLRYRIVKDRYQIELSSLINFLHKNTKLYNKLLRFGLGQYVERWKNF